MEIKNKKQQNGLCVLELVILMMFFLPFSFVVLGLYNFERTLYLLDEVLENNLGNKNQFVIRIDQDLNIIDGEVNRLQQRLVDIQTEMENTIDNMGLSDECSQTRRVEVELMQVQNNPQSNLMFFVNRRTNQRVQMPNIFIIRTTVSLGKDDCVGGALKFFNMMGDTIQSQRETLVDYQF